MIQKAFVVHLGLARSNPSEKASNPAVICGMKFFPSSSARIAQPSGKAARFRHQQQRHALRARARHHHHPPASRLLPRESRGRNSGLRLLALHPTPPARRRCCSAAASTSRSSTPEPCAHRSELYFADDVAPRHAVAAEVTRRTRLVEPGSKSLFERESQVCPVWPRRS